jgi:hypothetical protein
MIDLRKKDSMIAAIEEILQQEALKGNQHKIDKNKNNKIDAEDFKLLRKEENVDEGLKDVAKKAFKALTGGSDEDQLKNLQKKMGVPQTGKKPEPQKEEVVDESKGMPLHKRRANALNSDADKLAKRDKPNDFGTNRMLPQGRDLLKIRLKADSGKHTRPNLPEETEQIEELSKSTLGSYVKGAARDAGASHKLGADFKNQADKSKSPSSKAASSRLSDKFYNMAQKRHTGIGKAVERLTKEEEVMPKTLKQFKENAFDWKKKPEPTPNGGSGVKQGSRYGGSKQKDTPEQDTDEKK